MAGVITWREQLALDSALRVVDRWPAIALDALSQAQRRQYFKRCEIVKAVLNGTPTKSVAATFGISQSHVYDLLRRTLASPPDQRPALRNGLVRGRRIRPYKRHKPLGQSSQGAAGAFTWLQHEAADVFAALDTSGDGLVDGVCGAAARLHDDEIRLDLLQHHGGDSGAVEGARLRVIVQIEHNACVRGVEDI